MRFNIVVAIVVSTISVWPSESFAYIDPGTGSILIQGIIGAIAAIGVTLKLYWHRIVALFRRESTEDVASHETENTNAAGQSDDV